METPVRLSPRRVRTAPGPYGAPVPQVLVVEDDPAVADVLRRYLERDGLDVRSCREGPAALRAAAHARPDLVVLDLMMPGMDGLEVLRRLRVAGPVPVIVLTARGEEDDRLLGLEQGADDYVTKPFSAREVVLRVRSVLRRAAPAAPGPPAVLVDGDLCVDLAAHRVLVGGQARRLTAREYDLLVFLLRHPRQAYGRAELLREVWGWEHGDLSTVTVHLRRLREKLEPDPAHPERLVTVFGVGYRYDPSGPA